MSKFAKILSSGRSLVNKTSLEPQHRSLGDTARDARRWPDAVAHYRRHLEASPEDVAIWVQLGHSLKELKELEQAEAAYSQAVALDPNDGDAQLQIAHFFKVRDRPKRAAAAFRECMRIAPSESVYNELLMLGFEADAATLLEQAPFVGAGHARYFELRDLFEYFLQHSTVTGISRVVLGLINYILDEMPDEAAAGYHFVHQFGAGDALWLVPKNKLRRVADAAMAEVVDHQAIVDLIKEIKRDAAFVRLQRGDLYFIPGAFWDAAASPTFLPSLKSQGIYVGAYIYDLIPITHAHYCMAGLTEGFNIAFAESAACFDFTLTISKFVAEQVEKFIDARQLRRFPIVPVPLAHELQFRKRPANVPRRASAALDALSGRDFVLCVCTIEARKNHIYLFYIWQEMINDGIDVPDLVFVGRYGWRVNDLIGQIEASNYLDGRLHIMHGLSDSDLAMLYDTCQFTVFPSFVEGWGLPVGESLAHGKVCAASSVSSIPEVGGDLAVYLDPYNMRSGADVIRKLINDPAYLRQLEAKVRAGFTPRTWQDVGADFFARMDEVLAALPPSDYGRSRTWPNLSGGELLDVGHLQNRLMKRPDYVRNPLRMIFAEGWRNVEASGTWMRGPSAVLRFASGEKPGSRISALLCLSTSSWAGNHNGLQVHLGEDAPSSRDQAADKDYIRRPLLRDEKFWAKLKGQVDANGLVVVRLQVSGEVKVTDPNATPVLVRLHSVGFALEQDFAGRMDLLERATLPG